MTTKPIAATHDAWVKVSSISAAPATRPTAAIFRTKAWPAAGDVADGLGQLRILLIELTLDLSEDALLSLVQRHWALPNGPVLRSRIVQRKPS